jgi:hypothetical protein
MLYGVFIFRIHSVYVGHILRSTFEFHSVLCIKVFCILSCYADFCILSITFRILFVLLGHLCFLVLKGLSSEIGVAEIGNIQYIYCKGRGAKIFS